MQNAMGQFLSKFSKLHKNENNTDISLYLIYLPKLHKNILKYFRLNQLKEIAIHFSQPQNFLLVFQMVFLFERVTSSLFLAFSLSLLLHPNPHIIKGIAT